MSRRRFLVGASTVLVGTLTLSNLKPLLARNSRSLKAEIAKKRNKFWVPTTDQFRQAENKERNSESLQDLSADFEIGSNPDFEKSFTIGVEDRLLVLTPITNGDQVTGSVHTAILNADSLEEIESLGWTIRAQGENYRAIVKKNKQRLLDITVDSNGNIVKGFMLEPGNRRKDLAGQNFVESGKAAIATTLQEIQDAAFSPQASLVAVGSPLSCLNSCLASAGLPTWLIGTLGAICALACAVTAGTGCFVCAAAVLGSFLGLGAACFERCGFRTR
jgi:hypothetical protein